MIAAKATIPARVGIATAPVRAWAGTVVIRPTGMPRNPAGIQAKRIACHLEEAVENPSE
jgi:hypothetical protein